MSVLNQGRNEIRFNNSAGKCLLENWVEERAVAHIDSSDMKAECTSSAQFYKDGHSGVLSTDFDSQCEKLTTCRVSYKDPDRNKVREIGKKQELLEKMLLAKVSQEVHEEINAPPEPIDFKSVTMKDFMNSEFKSIRPKPTCEHDYKSEQPVSFWTEHKDRITGVSAIKPGSDTAFRKNDTFSTPIEEKLDEPNPYEIQNYPNM